MTAPGWSIAAYASAGQGKRGINTFAFDAVTGIRCIFPVHSLSLRMTRYIALLRGINVGGIILRMDTLRGLCQDMGLQNVRTYIQSGNVLFDSVKPEAVLQQALEAALEAEMGRQIPVILRTAGEMRSALDANPFRTANPARVGVLFFPQPIDQTLIEDLTGPGGEELLPSGRNLYIHYPDGMGRSRLKLPKALSGGTMRNMNTVAKLVQLGL